MEQNRPRATKVSASPSSSPALRNKEARLVVEVGAQVGRTIRLVDSRITVGRADEATVTLEDDRISRLHAELCRRSSGYWLRDLRSTNGTMLNGEPIDEALLSHGDRITIGSQQLRFVIEEDQSPRIYEIP